MSCQVGEPNTLMEDVRRTLHLPCSPEERAALRIALELREAQWRRDKEEFDSMDSEWERHRLRLAEGRIIRRAQVLTPFKGCLVSIGEPDHAESPPREVIDLTDDSEDDVLDLSGEEAAQALEEERCGVLTFHVEVERAQANPAPEYEAPPPGYDAPGPSRS